MSKLQELKGFCAILFSRTRSDGLLIGGKSLLWKMESPLTKIVSTKGSGENKSLMT